MLNSLVSAVVGSCAFAALFYVDKRNLLYVTMAGVLSTLAYFSLIEVGVNLHIAVFLATLIYGLYGEIMARVRKVTLTTFIICGMIPLVPGSGMYYMMVEFVNNNHEAALNILIETLGVAGMLALGIILSATIAKLVCDNFKVEKTSCK